MLTKFEPPNIFHLPTPLLKDHKSLKHTAVELRQVYIIDETSPIIIVAQWALKF